LQLSSKTTLGDGELTEEEMLKENTKKAEIVQSVSETACYVLAAFFLVYTLDRFTDLKNARKAIYYAFFGIVIALISTFYTPDWGYDDGFKWLVAFFLGGIPAAFIALKVIFQQLLLKTHFLLLFD
jgi:RsiW-degrading membrane proteinase PrsW (M82 family)